MDNLKTLTMSHHKRAERTNFVRRLLKKELTASQYYDYLYNQFFMYLSLELSAEKHGLFEGIEEIKRSKNIWMDIKEIEIEYNLNKKPILHSTENYINYILSISEDRDRILSHLYVRHMGDLSGGQIIKRYVPGSGLYYKFDGDTENIKKRIREKLHDGLANESMICFDMVAEFVNELEESFEYSRSSL